MGRAYSQDLRLRVLEAIDGGMSKMQAHRTFRVSRSTIDDWLLLRAEQGHLRDKPRVRANSGGALGDKEMFAAFAARHHHSTLEQMSEAWAEETGQKLSINTFSLALKRLGWTRKKRVSSMPNVTTPDAKSSSLS